MTQLFDSMFTAVAAAPTIEYFQYHNASGEDEVAMFIDRWFNSTDIGKHLRSSLDMPGKERIKDLANQPVLLALLCHTWNSVPELPDTQALLFDRFVDTLYELKVAEFPLECQIKDELNQGLGELARERLDNRFNAETHRSRFTESEIIELWQDRQLGLDGAKLSSVCNLGWLTCAGKNEHEEDIYTFLHPMFQEYFAASTIKDWDYFLPRLHDNKPVPCQGEIELTYRLFQSQWRQVVLF